MDFGQMLLLFTDPQVCLSASSGTEFPSKDHIYSRRRVSHSSGRAPWACMCVVKRNDPMCLARTEPGVGGERRVVNL